MNFNKTHLRKTYIKIKNLIRLYISISIIGVSMLYVFIVYVLIIKPSNAIFKAIDSLPICVQLYSIIALLFWLAWTYKTVAPLFLIMQAVTSFRQFYCISVFHFVLPGTSIFIVYVNVLFRIINSMLNSVMSSNLRYAFSFCAGTENMTDVELWNRVEIATCENVEDRRIFGELPPSSQFLECIKADWTKVHDLKILYSAHDYNIKYTGTLKIVDKIPRETTPLPSIIMPYYGENINEIFLNHKSASFALNIDGLKLPLSTAFTKSGSRYSYSDTGNISVSFKECYDNSQFSQHRTPYIISPVLGSSKVCIKEYIDRNAALNGIVMFPVNDKVISICSIGRYDLDPATRLKMMEIQLDKIRRLPNCVEMQNAKSFVKFIQRGGISDFNHTRLFRNTFRP